MSSFAKNCTATIIPGMRYKDAPAAIDFLCNAFGFHRHAVYPNPDGTIAHAQLTFGNGMIMLSSINQNPAGKHLRQPADVHGETQVPYIVVSDCDAIYKSAKAAGAEIANDIVDNDYGGRSFTARDPEGHLWNFGSYDPWAQS